MNKRTTSAALAVALGLSILAAPAVAQTQKKINQFPVAPNAISGADLVPLGQSGGAATAGVTYRSTFTALSTYVLNSGLLGGDCTITALSMTCTKTGGATFGTFATQNFATPPVIGGTTPNVVNASSLSASGTVTGAGFNNLFAAPPALGGTTPNAIHGTTGGFTGLLTTAASSSSGAGLNLPQGAAPTTPNNGDIWVTTAGIFVRANGVTVGPLGSGGGGGGVTIGAAITGSCTNGYNLYNNSGVIGCQPNGGGGGTVTTSGSPANGNLTKFSGASAITNGDLSGAVTTSGSLVTALSANAVGTSNINNSAVTLAKIANAAANAKLLGSGASGTGAPYVELALGPTMKITGTTVDTAGQVLAGTTQAITSALFNPGVSFAVTTAAQTLTLDAANTMSSNGGAVIQTIGQSVTLALASGTDAINGGTAGASVTIGANLAAYVTTDGSGAYRVSPTTNSGSGTVTSVICGAGLSGGTITTTGTCSLNLGNANVWTATQTFAGVNGSSNTQSGTTYSLVATDCGKTVIFTNAGAVTVTIPASIVPATGTTCAIAVLQSGAGQVSVNGSATTPATLKSAHSYTKTFGQDAMIGLTLTTIGATATATLTGDGA